MSWYDNARTTIAVQPYNVTDTRRGIADAERQEIANKGSQFDQTQKQNMDYAFTNSVEQKKVVDPKTGAITYSLYLDPDKYADALFKQSKKTGIPFNMDDAQAYSKYALGRMQTTSQMSSQKTGQEQQGIKVEGKPSATTTTQTKGTVPAGTIGEKRKDKNGTEWTFDGTGWYIDQTPGGF